MRRHHWLLAMACWAAGLSGCRCCCLFEPYNNLIDHIKDYPVLFDQWYCPRLDISRAGKPDWCGPINRHLGPCRCCDQPEWTRYDDCWLYPPVNPYEFPNHSFPGPSQSQPVPKPANQDLEERESAPLIPEKTTVPPAPELDLPEK